MARETVPAKPFADWLNARVDRFEGDYYHDYRQQDRTPEQRLAESLGIHMRTLNRYRSQRLESKRKGKNVSGPTEAFPRGRVEEMLHRAGFFLWDVYPEDDYPDLYAVEELRLAPLVTLMREEIVYEARSLYDSGASFNEIARELLSQSGYASGFSFSDALRREWRNQGWAIRSRTAAIRLAAKMRATGGCADTSRGMPCEHRPMTGSKYCFQHSRRVGDMIHARGHLDEALSIGPFATWLRARAVEVGGYKPLGNLVGVNNAQVSRWARCVRGDPRHGSVPATFVQRRSVERVLAAWGDGTTLDDIYREDVAA